jgi:hypothetical protein
MKMIIDWVSDHVLTTLLIAVMIYATGYVMANRKSLFYKK